MDSADSGLLAHNPWVARRKFSVGDYHRMGAVGILTDGDRVELIDGELVLMSPVGSQHAGTVNALTHLLTRLVGDRTIVAVQNPVRLGDRSEPQPDLALLRPRADFYRGETPRPDDVLLLIEVADTSLEYERVVKRALYAGHAIVELWIVNLPERVVEVSREPAGERYAISLRADIGSVLQPQAFPGVAVPVAAIFS